MKFTGVMLGTEDPKKLGEFYTKIFGKPQYQDDSWYGFDIGGGSLMIGSHSEVRGKNQSPARIMIVLESDNVKDEFSRIRDLGAEVIADPYQPNEKDTPGVWLATLADSDGNYLQLSTPWSGQ